MPAGSTLARFSTFDADFPAGTDVDLFVYQAGTTDLVGQSAGGSAEEIDPRHRPRGLVRPVRRAVRRRRGAEQHADGADVRLGAGRHRQGNLTVTPASQSVTAGTPASVTAAWSGLTAGSRYLGRISYGDGTDTAGGTLVRVDA